ncbi:hypothetical protein FHX75_11666 [Micromonospora palomenae]|jgi:hypothetical protein|uniref:Uncharacterized protein n=2 Tax=Micromonospora TaxID=1873 RepID=A0A561WUH2_9ACTN|nr:MULTISPECIES: hypothetical protein [Micromonospora]MDH6460842.1 hypothetical protein [Micromonospora sp. A200]TWG27522.1 hypothetical protein FHX75_11666 [Micromonospora palomenae]SCF18102.1 hypothetical protein GA0074696_3226 [Micromonospora purpureochromogenes]
MDTVSIDTDYLVATLDEDDDPESLAGDEVDFDLAAALEEEE